jgi:ribosome biogenesis ATPase
MSRLSSALDNEIHIATQRFVSQGVAAESNAIYNAIQKSNSSLKRKPKKLIQASIERVLDFMGLDNSDDSEAGIEERISAEPTDVELMNRSLRANLNPAGRMENRPASPAEPSEDGAKKRRMANGEPVPKRQKSSAASMEPPKDFTLEDVGGMEQVIEQMTDLIVPPLMNPERYQHLGVKMPNGILFHGPPGCGKTMVSRAFAGEIGLAFVEILGPSIVSGMSGESERAIRERFEEAKRNAPCLVFMDEIDAIAPKRDTSQSQMEKRIVAQILVCMDELQRDSSKPVIVLATTNRPDSIDPALRRGGRFDTEINISVPNQLVRRLILEAQTRNTPLGDDVDFETLSKMTAGFVGADLHDLVSKAASWQLKRYYKACEAQMIYAASDSRKVSPAVQHARRLIERLKSKDMAPPPGFEDDCLKMEAFLAVLPKITPSSKREGFATVPDVSWNDVGALQHVREELQAAIVQPIKDPSMYKVFGITAPTGVLLWGPPGCGKTLLAKAVAAESKANFISVKGPELLNKFVGESEAAVRRVFTRARSSVPCVIFFDELDALVPRRDDTGSEASARVVNTLLTELDGMDERTGIYIIAATNRPDMIDEAMLRPGRLGQPLFVDLPDENARAEILSTLLRGKPVEDLPAILEVARHQCKMYSGADLSNLMQLAARLALGKGSRVLQPDDFRRASGNIKGSVQNIEQYYGLKAKFRN